MYFVIHVICYTNKVIIFIIIKKCQNRGMDEKHPPQYVQFIFPVNIGLITINNTFRHSIVLTVWVDKH